MHFAPPQDSHFVRPNPIARRSSSSPPPGSDLQSLFVATFEASHKEEPRDYAEALADFEQKQLDGSTQFYTPLYAGHMNFDISKPHYDALIRTLKLNQNIVAEESAPVACRDENELIRLMAALVGYDPKTSWGYVTVGGTIANLEGLWIARNKARAAGRNPRFVLAHHHAHYSIRKACDILGLQLCPLEISEEIPPKEIAAVVCTIGYTETGNVDDIGFWLTYCAKHHIHLHADAAYGGYYAYCKHSRFLRDDTKQALELMKEADSITIDPHKCGYAPYAIGIFLLKHVEDNRHVNLLDDVHYIQDGTSGATVEGSRSGAIVSAALFGHNTIHPFYHTILEANLIGARMLKDYFESNPNFELLPDTDMAIVLFTLKTPSSSETSTTSTSAEKVRKVSMAYLTERFCKYDNVQSKRLQLVTTEIGGRVYFRICVMNPFLKDHLPEFIKQFEADYELYCSEFDAFVNARVENILSICEECDTKEELVDLVRSGQRIVAYNGFEPSGRIHIAQAIVTVLNARVLVQNGCHVRLYIADWFAQMNHKLDGDLDRIKCVGRYFVEVFKACGIPDSVEFVWASEFISHSDTYWPRVLNITTQTTVKRAIRCSQIMGRKEDDALSVSQLLYPCMQAADIFELGVSVAQLGNDQRKCNMLAREYAEKVHTAKPISATHHMLMGLKGPQAGKMSKSIPDSAVFMEDPKEEVDRKIMCAFCNDEVEGNPVFEYLKYIVFRWFPSFTVSGKTYTKIEDLEAEFASINKKDLKVALADAVNAILQPVRDHFSTGEMKDLAEKVASFRVTR